MEKIFKDYLFTKNIFVADKAAENPFETCFSLAKLFDIKITEGAALAHKDMIRTAEELLGRYVPYPFYKGFPESVRELSQAQLLFDQLVHYTVTYGFGCVSAPGHSIFERDFERIAFNEETEPKKFIILTEEAAEARLMEAVEDMLSSSRPLSEMQYEVVSGYIALYSYKIQSCACKDTAMRLLCENRDTYYVRFLALSDILKVVERINYEDYDNRNIRKLNLRNVDRRFITGMLDLVLERGRCDVRECFERKAVWNGLLHHIHYKPKCENGVSFLSLMRGEGNRSVYSDFERYMAERDIKEAVRVLRSGKGAGAVLRNLNYIISRCESEEEVNAVLGHTDTDKALLLIQLIMQYGAYSAERARSFKFVKYNLMRKHTETEEEMEHRRSALSKEKVQWLSNIMKEKLKALLGGKLGRVYIAPEMHKMAIPLQESASSGGYGVLAKGSRISLPKGKVVRAFTYWEKVDDIDLSVVGIMENGEQKEFSWRNMYRKQSNGIGWSGDQTSGYGGGSEYFDIDPVEFKKEYPEIKYLVFSNNMFSWSSFDKCVCRAGYMMRSKINSGEVYEPKTVKSAFAVKGDNSFSYLFGIDLGKREFVWLNVNRDSSTRVAGTTSFAFLIDYFQAVDTLSLADLFAMLASEVVEDPALADTVLGDGEYTLAEGAEQIRSYDFEKITKLLG